MCTRSVVLMSTRRASCERYISTLHSRLHIKLKVTIHWKWTTLHNLHWKWHCILHCEYYTAHNAAYGKLRNTTAQLNCTARWTVVFSTVQLSVVQYRTVQNIAVQWNAEQCSKSSVAGRALHRTAATTAATLFTLLLLYTLVLLYILVILNILHTLYHSVMTHSWVFSAVLFIEVLCRAFFSAVPFSEVLCSVMFNAVPFSEVLCSAVFSLQLALKYQSIHFASQYS